MNQFIQIMIRSILIILAIALCIMLYQLYGFAKAVQYDLEQKNKNAEKFLRTHEMSGVIINLNHQNKSKNQPTEFTIKLSDHSLKNIPCFNQYIINCDPFGQVEKITIAQEFHPIPKIGQKVCKPKGELVFNVCK